MFRRKHLLIIAVSAVAIWLSFVLFTPPACGCLDLFPPRIYRLETINPLRDPLPERAAEKFLQDLSAGKRSPDDFCRNLRIGHRLTAWRLVARQNQTKDGTAAVHLYYRIKSIEGSKTLFGQAEVTVKPDGSGWKPSDFVALF